MGSERELFLLAWLFKVPHVMSETPGRAGQGWAPLKWTAASPEGEVGTSLLRDVPEVPAKVFRGCPRPPPASSSPSRCRRLTATPARAAGVQGCGRC